MFDRKDMHMRRGIVVEMHMLFADGCLSGPARQQLADIKRFADARAEQIIEGLA